MSSFHRSLFTKRLTAKAVLIAAAALVCLPARGLAQTSNAQAKTAPSTSSEKGERWLHVRVICTDGKGDTVRVNVPLELAEKVLPAVNHDRLHNGKVRIDSSNINDVDLRAVMEAVRSAKDGEYVTVQGNDNDVRVAKEGNHLMIHVVDKSGPKKSQVEVKVPMKVVEALLSAGKDELDLVAALHALGAQGDVELVSVKDSENTVKVWLDSKNVAD
jgi:invasion protein IalB